MKEQEHEFFFNLRNIKGLWKELVERPGYESSWNLTEDQRKLYEAFKKTSGKETREAIIAALSESPFPLQKYAENIKARTEIETFMIDVMTELKHGEEPGTTSPGSMQNPH